MCLFCLTLLPAWSGGAETVDHPAVYDYAVIAGNSKVNMRIGPSADTDLCGSAVLGDWVGILGETDKWYYAYIPAENQYGYMSKTYVKRSDGQGQATGVVNNPKATQFLNLRAAPSYQAPVLGIYYNGTPFLLLASAADGWYQVEVGGQTGYFRSEYTLLDSAESGRLAVIQSPNPGLVNLRNMPYYTGSTVIAQFPSGTQALVLLTSATPGSFWKVRVNGVTGYMDSAYLNSAPPAEALPAAGNGTAEVNNPKATQYLNLRSLPTTSARVIGQYRNGVRFQVLEPGETWTKVYSAANGAVGYFQTRYLTLTGVSASPTKTVENDGSYVNLRSSPSKAEGKVYVRVPSGAAVTVLIPGDEWCQVRYAGTVGYMMTCFLK